MRLRPHRLTRPEHRVARELRLPRPKVPARQRQDARGASRRSVPLPCCPSPGQDSPIPSRDNACREDGGADARTADEAAADYRRLAGELASLPETAWLSVDLSHLGLDVAPQRCARHLAAIAAALPPGRRIQVGAEDHTRADGVLASVLTAAEQGLADQLGATVQANLRRAPADLDRLLAAGVHIRLVKGAFVQPPEHGLPYGEPTDVAYVHLAHRLADTGARFALATHDGVLREALLAALGPRPIEQLLGVRPTVLDDLTARDVPARVYVPFGDSWFRYWMRRVAESRGA